ncbi:MAG: hypothetical protein COA97_02670 [Flavobacteriales bacterium]|nr:MAG: hypothetical protein COA97_02670 [Flavobacteriales bacterium]
MDNYKNPDLMNWETGKVKGFSGKNLIDLKNGGLKMVKVAANATYPSHLHPEKTEFIYVLEGNPIIEIGEENYNGKQGNFFILPHAVKHSIINPTELECLLLVGAINN